MSEFEYYLVLPHVTNQSGPKFNPKFYSDVSHQHVVMVNLTARPPESSVCSTLGTTTGNKTINRIITPKFQL